MEDQLVQQQKWWQKNKRLLIGAIITIIAILIALALFVYWFGWDWTGFNSGASKITITSTSKGITTATEIQPAKSLWDWLQLLGILAIPVVVGLGTVLFTTQQANESDKNREKRHKTDLEIAEKNREREQETAIKIAADNQHEAAFRAYLDKMSELLIERGLAKSSPDNQVRNIARIQTLAVLLGLDATRKRSVILFLYESGLINKNNRIVELQGADLYQADLNRIYLRDAHLGGSFCWKVDFSAAILHGAYLGGVEFREVNWTRADLSEAYLDAATFLDADGNKYTTDIAIEEQLKEAKSLQGATMPDGSIHP